MNDSLIKGIDLNNTYFQRCFKKLSGDVRKEVKRALAELMLIDINAAPAKLHLHSLKDKIVPSAVDPTQRVKVFTIHVTTNDSYKASFTFENGTAYFRTCGKHNEIDKNP